MSSLAIRVFALWSGDWAEYFHHRMTENQQIAGSLEEVSRILAEQGANRFRVQAYVHAADALRAMAEPLSAVLSSEGLEGLEKIPGVGDTIAHVIRDIVLHGSSGMLDRLRGESDPIAQLASVPGIGKNTAWKLHEELGIETLQELEAAAHDGRLEKLAGIGPKRLAGIRDTLALRLGRLRKPPPSSPSLDEPSIAELLDVDRQYREDARAGKIKLIAPKRFNPTGEAWLPVLHTTRGERHYTALFSNTARAHELGKTSDWVVLFYDGDQTERQCTVITSEFGPLKGHRIVRGREAECEDFYRSPPSGRS
jgi:DNA polymerase (family X)